MRYGKKKLGSGWRAVVGEEAGRRGRGGGIIRETSGSRSDGSRAASPPRISSEKCQRWQLGHQSGFSPSDVFLSPDYLKGHMLFPPPEKLAAAQARAREQPKRTPVKLNLITLHEIRYWFVFQMTAKRFLSGWYGIYTSCRYFSLPPDPRLWIEECEMMTELMAWKCAIIMNNARWIWSC